MNKTNISKIKKRLIIIGVVTILILGVQRVVQYLQVDACLDKGGCWDYNLKKCNCSHTLLIQLELQTTIGSLNTIQL